MNINDPIGKPGLLFLGSGYLLNIVHNVVRTVSLWQTQVFAWGGFVCTCIGGIYYLLKIHNDFIKKPKEK